MFFYDTYIHLGDRGGFSEGRNRKEKRNLQFAYPKNYQFFIVCLNLSISKLSRDDAIGDHKHLFYFITENDGYIRLHTIKTFVSRKPSIGCGNRNQELVEINRFSKKTNAWEKKSFEMLKKYDNLNGCPLNIFFPRTYLEVEKKYLGSFDELKAFKYLMHYKIFEGLERHLNYSFKPKFRRAELTTFSADLSSYMNYHVPKGSLTRPYWFRSLHFAIPVGEEYSDFEKLLLPFEFPVWIWIVFTFVTAYVTIFLLQFVKSSIRNAVIGNISTPTLNIAMIFSGTSQVKMPVKSFARFLVMNFIIFSMIFRTAWQGTSYMLIINQYYN